MGYTPPIEINIGSPAIDRNTKTGTATWVLNEISASGTGKITTVEIWAADELSNCKVATFFVVSGNSLSTRDYETVDNGNGAGVVLAGSKQIFTVDLDVVEGDLIGMYFLGGNIELTTNQPTGCRAEWNDFIPCENHEFYVQTGKVISLYGIGTTGAGQLTIGDSFSVADSFIKNVTKQLGEAFAIVDSLWYSQILYLYEAFSVVDSKITSGIKYLTETFSTVDSFVHTTILHLYEAFSAVDSLVKNAIKQSAEMVSVIDSKVIKVVKALTEAFSIVDSFAHTIILYFYETLKVTDSFIKHLRTFWHKVIKSVAVYTKVDLKEEIPWEEMTWKNLGDVTWLDIANMTWRDLSVEAVSFYKKVIKKISTYEKVKK